jgi:hypothetical protein
MNDVVTIKALTAVIEEQALTIIRRDQQIEVLKQNYIQLQQINSDLNAQLRELRLALTEQPGEVLPDVPVKYDELRTTYSLKPTYAMLREDGRD